MKLFIPTCTLNLNNILSTESVSPPIFYQKRMFGNKRFEKVEANNFDNLLVLYSKLPLFEIKDEGLDNFWMVLEVETEALPTQPEKVAQVHGIDIYTCKSTIYLNPFTTTFYFPNAAIFPKVASRTEQSLENKLFAFYDKIGRFQPQPHVEKLFQWELSYTAQIADTIDAFCENKIKSDRIIDRIKGFSYCYLIGANSSSSKEISELKLLTHKVRNTLSAIVNSPERKPTSIQDQALLSSVNRFSLLYKSIDEAWITNNKKIDKKLEQSQFIQKCGLSRDAILEDFERLGIKEVFLRACYLEKAFDVNYEIYEYAKRYREGSSENYNSVIERLINAVSKLERIEIGKLNPHNKDDLFIISSGNIITMKDIKFPLRFYNDFVNYLINTDFDREVSNKQKNLSIALHCGKMMKEEISKIAEWQDSSFQKYINSLLDNLEHSSKFDIDSTDSEELKHFAAFIQKGSDIDNLSDYMLQCGFSDNRLAFGLYGASEGFATLPKTFTKHFFDGNKDYVSSFIKDIYKVCFGKSLDPLLFLKTEISERTHISSDNNSLIDRGYNEAINNLMNSIKSNVPAFPISEAAENYYVEKLSSFYTGVIDQEFYDSSAKISSFQKKDSWKKVLQFFKRQITKKSNKNITRTTFSQSSLLPTLSVPGNPKHFYKDKDAKNVLNDILDSLGGQVSPDIRKKIHDNLNYLQKNYMIDGKYYNELENPRCNNKVLIHFENLCFKSNNHDKLDDTAQNRKLFGSIIKEMRSYYNDNQENPNRN